MTPLIVESFYGFGDNLFLRPLLLEESKIRDIYLQTPYPQLFKNTNVKMIKPHSFLYDFANRSISEINGSVHYEHKPNGWFLRPTYSAYTLKEYKTISMCFSKGFSNRVFDTKLKATDEQLAHGKRLIKTDKPIAIFKIPSFRHDWLCESRTPKTQYMIECMRIAKEMGYYIVSMQDFTLGDRLGEPELERVWVPLCDQLLHGKLTIDEIIGVVATADVVVTYPNFLLPLGINLDKSVFCLYGGSIAPECIIDPRMRPRHYRYVAPNPFCNCIEAAHDCNKEIADDYKDKFRKFILETKTKDEFFWNDEIGYGYLPVDNAGVYGDEYFDKYVGYENTSIGEKLNDARVNLAREYTSGKILDVGVGSGQFIRAVDGIGYDVCQKAIKWLKDSGRWVDFWKTGAYNADLVTFFDSFEHEDNIDGLLTQCMGRPILISLPIFRDKEHAMSSKHYRPNEHYHYFTRDGLIRWFKLREYRLVYQSDIEVQIGREDIGTFIFEREPLR